MPKGLPIYLDVFKKMTPKSPKMKTIFAQEKANPFRVSLVDFCVMGDPHYE